MTRVATALLLLVLGVASAKAQRGSARAPEQDEPADRPLDPDAVPPPPNDPRPRNPRQGPRRPVRPDGQSLSQPGRFRVDFAAHLGLGGSLHEFRNATPRVTADLRPSVGLNVSIVRPLGAYFACGADLLWRSLRTDGERFTYYAIDGTCAVRWTVRRPSLALESQLEVGFGLGGSAGGPAGGGSDPGVDGFVRAAFTVWTTDQMGFVFRAGYRQTETFPEPALRNSLRQAALELGFRFRAT